MLGGDGVLLEGLELNELSQLANYFQPHAPGALLKAAIVCAEIVEFPSAKPLVQQLSEKFGCGFKLQSMSNVPQGSGGCGMAHEVERGDCSMLLLQVSALAAFWVEPPWQHCGEWPVRSTQEIHSSMQ